MKKQIFTLEEKKRKDYTVDKEIELKEQMSLIKVDLSISLVVIALIIYAIIMYTRKGENPILLIIGLIIESLDFTKNFSNLVHKEAKRGLRFRIILKCILRVLLAIFILKLSIYSKTIRYFIIAVIAMIIGIIDDGK